MLREWQFFGANLFEAELILKKASVQPVLLAVLEGCIYVLSSNYAVQHFIPYKNLRHFGASGGNFRLLFKHDGEVIHLLFNLPQVSYLLYTYVRGVGKVWKARSKCGAKLASDAH